MQFPIAISLFTIATFFFAYIFVGGFLWGAGFQPIPRKSLIRMIELSSPKEGMVTYDLGSGFGRIVIAVAERTKASCIGVEIDPIKCWWSRYQINKRRLGSRAIIIRANLMSVNLGGADIVYLFLWSGIMQRLKAKILSEMKPGCVVLSYWHKFNGWEPEYSDDKLKVYLYRVPHRSYLPAIHLSLGSALIRSPG